MSTKYHECAATKKNKKQTQNQSALQMWWEGRGVQFIDLLIDREWKFCSKYTKNFAIIWEA